MLRKNNLTREKKYLFNSRYIFLPFFCRTSHLITSQLNYLYYTHYYTTSKTVNRKLGMRAHSPEIKCRHLGREGFFRFLFIHQGTKKFEVCYSSHYYAMYLFGLFNTCIGESNTSLIFSFFFV